MIAAALAVAAAATTSALARAEGQQHFFAQRILEFFELERAFTLVAENLENHRTRFFGHFDARVVQLNDVHLERLDEKFLLVPATRTSQRHEHSFLTPHVTGASNC